MVRSHALLSKTIHKQVYHEWQVRHVLLSIFLVFLSSAFAQTGTLFCLYEGQCVFIFVFFFFVFFFFFFAFFFFLKLGYLELVRRSICLRFLLLKPWLFGACTKVFFFFLLKLGYMERVDIAFRTLESRIHLLLF